MLHRCSSTSSGSRTICTERAVGDREETWPWNLRSGITSRRATLTEPVVERLRRFPREPDMLVYGLRMAAALLCRGWLRLYHRLSISGRENLPAEGSFVMVANHASHLDALCLLAALPMATAASHVPGRGPGLLLREPRRACCWPRSWSTRCRSIGEPIPGIA